MSEKLLTLRILGNAEIAYSALGPEDQRHVDAWFDHLRNWPSDEFIRSKSKRLKDACADKGRPLWAITESGDFYFFKTSSDIIIVFKITSTEVIVISIFREEALRTFKTMAERSTA